jgi:hypothetical protein
MKAATELTTPDDIREVAEVVIAQYPSAPSEETEAAIAVLGLWALDAVQAGRLHRNEANDIFVRLDVGISDQHSGPDLSDEIHDLILEGEHLHHYGEDWGPDPEQIRRLAFTILRRSKD